MNLQVKFLREGAVLPRRGTEGSAGYDLCACVPQEVTIAPGEAVLFPIGIAIALPQGSAGLIYTRSGLGVRHGIAVANGVGVIDSDYRGELHVCLRNFSGEPYTVAPGERIAQLIVTPVLLPEIVEVLQLDDTARGTGGFGSTGRK